MGHPCMCVRARLAQKKASPHSTQEFRRPIQKASTAKTSKSSSFGTLLSSQLGTLLSSQLKSLLCMYRIGNIKSSSASCQCLQPGACTELTEFDHITLPSFRLATLLEKRDVRRNCCLQISTRSRGRAHNGHTSARRALKHGGRETPHCTSKFLADAKFCDAAVNVYLESSSMEISCRHA